MAKSCSTTTTYFGLAPALLTSSRMTLVAMILCLTSRKEVGSSNMYTSASFITASAIARRCSSPPLSVFTSASSRCSRSKSCNNFSETPR
mmetsp:Transcript_20848/g.36150  ORF Transcript_20848/g.36150 Transcript_20848/m.36150 type:complete len:90 (+) Transcript_20848:199-468(+)